MRHQRTLEYSVESLSRDSHLAVQFRLRLARRVEYFVEASTAVAAYIVTPRELANFRRGDDFSPEVGYRRRVIHDDSVSLEPGLYYLLVINYSAAPVAVHYYLADEK